MVEPWYPAYWRKSFCSASYGMRSPSATLVHPAGALSPRSWAARVALRRAREATALVKTPSSTPLLYSSGPATFLTE